MLFFLPVQLNPLDAVLHIQNIAEKENNNVEMMFVYLKTETKPFTQNAYVAIIYRDIYHRCTRASHKRA